MDESSEPNFKNCKKDIERMTVKEQDMQKLIQTLKEDIEHLESELQGRDETIEKMEKENSDLMKTNQELQKYKHAADVTIQDQKKKIEEQEEDIKEKTEKIQGMDDEFVRAQAQLKQLQFSISQMKSRLKKENEESQKERQKMEDEFVRAQAQLKQLQFNISQMKSRLKKENEESQKERQKVQDVVELVKNFQTDLQKCVGLIQGNNVLKQKIRELHAPRYVQKSDVENVTFRKEINDLRRELKLSSTKVQELEKEKALRLSKKNHPLLSADSKGFAGAGRKSSVVLQLKPPVEETTKKIVLPQIKIKGLMQPEKMPPSSVTSRVGKLPALRLSR